MSNRSNLIPATPQNAKCDKTRLGELLWLLQKVCFVTGTAMVLLQTSCVGPRPSPFGGGMPPGLEPIVPPAFLTADIAALFSDANGFTVRLTFETSDAGIQNPMPLHMGELLGRGGNLLFLPEVKRQWRGPPGAAAGGVSFLWNSHSNAAFVLSEPLQGYAPVLANADSAHRSSSEATLLGNEIVNGERCQKWLVTCSAENAATNVFTVWRATALNEMPIKIQFGSGLSAVTLSLSKISFKQPSPESFAVPDGFTRYASLETMMAELMARQSSMMPRRMGDMPGRMPGGPRGEPPPGGGPP